MSLRQEENLMENVINFYAVKSIVGGVDLYYMSGHYGKSWGKLEDANIYAKIGPAKSKYTFYKNKGWKVQLIMFKLASSDVVILYSNPSMEKV